MRVLSDIPTAADADDASSTTPLLVTPASVTTTGGAALLPLPPEAGGGGGSVYPDSNMVIILAALLCALIGLLGLNSLVRCARHCGGRSSSLAMGGAPAATTTPTPAIMVVAPRGRRPVAAVVGLNKRELRKIPVVEYESNKAGGGGVVPAAGDAECAICLGEFADGEKVRLLPRCHHGFHVGCIDAWLAAHSSCPICRDSLLDEDDDHHADAGEATVDRIVAGDEAT